MNIFLPIISNIVLGAQKNCLIEIILLSTFNICFGREIIKIILITCPSYMYERACKCIEICSESTMQCQNRENFLCVLFRLMIYVTINNFSALLG